MALALTVIESMEATLRNTGFVELWFKHSDYAFNEKKYEQAIKAIKEYAKQNGLLLEESFEQKTYRTCIRITR